MGIPRDGSATEVVVCRGCGLRLAPSSRRRARPPTRGPSFSACCSTPRCVGTVSALSASAHVTCTRCSMTPSTRLLSDTGVRRGRPPRARRCPSTPPSTAAGGGARPRCRVRGCGSRARTSRLVATPGMRAAPPVRPSTQEMLTISRPPPRRCSAACLPGSATRRLCIFFAYRWLPRDHAPCLYPVSCPGRPVRVFYPFQSFNAIRHPGGEGRTRQNDGSERQTAQDRHRVQP